MYNWNSIKKIRITAYIILAVNVGLGLFLVYSECKSTIHHEHIDGQAGYIHAKRRVKLRRDPDANSNSLVSIGNGEPVQILNDTSTVHKGWIQINYNGNIGWVWGDYIGK
ncbi:SH3 domain-containing protein [Mucilaginibacter lappiensis]|uniref:Uncharacterized protein YgiM (DUF1202 family) n=1 Tax=Mucilaginibacter lappiensis TaxID=354630 RepID=A0A841JKL7_9SPHI|nr:SH3 domain-containing protein [Mucilaginibacter lappiensis]MBB6130146.1 uncharacterized protein YgiM (DUF1202 family) [Mucilaginibacter lappiensis]